MHHPMTANTLKSENVYYHTTGGVSHNNRAAGFRPAFRDSETGRTELSRFLGGCPAPCHLIDGLPDDWVRERDTVGRALSIKCSVIAGFVRDGRFFTREEAARAVG
jgi:hypothetical protein